MKSEGSGVDGGCDASVFLSILTFVLPGVSGDLSNLFSQVLLQAS